MIKMMYNLPNVARFKMIIIVFVRFHCKQVRCDYVFVVDADITLTNRETLRILIEQNR